MEDEIVEVPKDYEIDEGFSFNPNFGKVDCDCKDCVLNQCLCPCHLPENGGD